MTVGILGRPYTIQFVEARARDDHVMGQCDTKVAKIIVCEGLDPYGRRQTILHEIVHAIGEDLCLGLSEQQVAALAVGLASVEQLRLEISL